MKKKKSSRTGRVLTRIFNLRSWLDWDRGKSATLYIASSLQWLFSFKEKNNSKDKDPSFGKAVKDLGLTENDLQIKQTALYRLSIAMLALALLIFTYCIYNLANSYYKAALVSFSVTLIALALAFRYHFWYFQISRQKLGCSFMQWYKQGLLGDKE